MYIPNANLKYNIYDILHNDNNKIVIVMPAETDAIKAQLLTESEKLDFILYKCPHRHVYIYVLQREVEYSETIQLLINDEKKLKFQLL